jgi:hypothetical protein
MVKVKAMVKAEQRLRYSSVVVLIPIHKIGG